MTPHLGVPFIVLGYEVLKNSILLIMAKWAQQTLQEAIAKIGLA